MKGRFEHVSSTLWRQRQEYSSRIIQQFFRKYVLKKQNSSARQISDSDDLEEGDDFDEYEENDEQLDEEESHDVKDRNSLKGDDIQTSQVDKEKSHLRQRNTKSDLDNERRPSFKQYLGK